MHGALHAWRASPPFPRVFSNVADATRTTVAKRSGRRGGVRDRGRCDLSGGDAAAAVAYMIEGVATSVVARANDVSRTSDSVRVDAVAERNLAETHRAIRSTRNDIFSRRLRGLQVWRDIPKSFLYEL